MTENLAVEKGEVLMEIQVGSGTWFDIAIKFLDRINVKRVLGSKLMLFDAITIDFMTLDA